MSANPIGAPLGNPVQQFFAPSRISLLGACRLLFLCFTALTCSSAYVGLYTEGSHTEHALLGRLLLPLLLLWWFVGLRRGRFPVWAEPIEALLVFLVGLGFVDFSRAISIFNAALLYRGLFGPLWVGIGRLALYQAAYFSLPQLSGQSAPDDIIGMAVALCLVTALARVLYAVLSKHEKAQKREQEVHAASTALAGTRIYSDVPHAIIGPLIAMTSDEVKTGAVMVLSASDTRELEVVALSTVLKRSLLHQKLSLDTDTYTQLQHIEGRQTQLIKMPEWQLLLSENVIPGSRGPRAPEVLFAPFINRGELTGGIVVADSKANLTELAESIASLAATCAIAIDGIRSRERFVSLVRNSNDLITIVDNEGRVRYQSTATTRLFGHSDTALLNKPLRDVISEEHRWIFDDLLESAVKAPATPISAEWQWRHQEGYWVYTESIATNLLHEPSVRGIVLNTRDVTERKRLEDELRHRASHDALTGLPNRALFHERISAALARAERNGNCVAVMYMDLDNFKGINDSYGHDAGDQLLTAFGTILRQSIRAYDTACRLGGDEFAVLLEDIESEDVALLVARRILAAAKAPVTVASQELLLKTSIGIALSTPGDSNESVLHKADQAMYVAKASGKDRYQLYGPDLTALR